MIACLHPIWTTFFLWQNIWPQVHGWSKLKNFACKICRLFKIHKLKQKQKNRDYNEKITVWKGKIVTKTKTRSYTPTPSEENTVVGDNINIMKTTFELNFDFYQAFKQHGYTKIWKQRKSVNLKSFTLITCKLVIRKKLVNN